MKINDLFGLDDKLEHFVVHSAEEELASVEIKKVEISREGDKIAFTFSCIAHDKNRKPGRQKDLSDKLQKRVNKFHKNYIKNVLINVYEM